MRWMRYGIIKIYLSIYIVRYVYGDLYIGQGQGQKMPKTVVSLSDIYEYKLNINMKSLIWYRQPVSQFTTARIRLFNHTTNLGFGNQSILGVKQVQYQIGDSLQLASFYDKPIIIQLINSNDGKNGGQAVAYCQLDPRIITEKPIIAPILSNCCSCVKLGDIQVQFKLTKSATDVAQLRQINASLDKMIHQCPNHFDNLYCKVKKGGHICDKTCC